MCMHVETRYFLIFPIILETTRNFLNSGYFFSSFTKYYFVQKQKIRYIQWNLPDLQLVNMEYFLIFSE